MNPFAATPYLSELKEQSELSLEQNQLLRERNQLLLERNNLLDKQNSVFKRMLRHQNPGIVFDDDQFLDILKGLYTTGREIVMILDPSVRQTGEDKRGAHLQLLKKRYGELVQQLDQNLGNNDNYFSSDDGVVKRFQSVLDRQSFDPFNLDTASLILIDLNNVYLEFGGLSVEKILLTEDTWNLPVTLHSVDSNQASS
jgi:hypothetical protein